MENLIGIETVDSLNLQKQINSVTQEDITHIGNTYNNSKKVDNIEKIDIISDNIVFSNTDNKDSNSSSDFDNALSLVSTTDGRENHTEAIEKQSGMGQFNTWFGKNINENAVEIKGQDILSERISEQVEQMKIKNISDFKSVMADNEPILTVEEIEKENRKFSDFLAEVHPEAKSQMKQTKNYIPFEDSKDNKIEIAHTENLLIKPTLIETVEHNEESQEKECNNVEKLENKDFKLIPIYECPNQDDEKLSLVQKDNVEYLGGNNSPNFNDSVTIPSLNILNHVEKPLESTKNALIGYNKINQTTAESIEQIQQALLKLQFQATKNAAQIEENILLQKLKITKLERKIKEVELYNLQMKEKEFKK